MNNTIQFKIPSYTTSPNIPLIKLKKHHIIIDYPLFPSTTETHHTDTKMVHGYDSPMQKIQPW
jgi:hypothetical protein